MDVLLDGVDECHVLLGGVGVVHTQSAQAAELLGSTEIDDQRLAVADVQIPVGLRRETGVHSLTGIAAALCDILFNKSVDEIFAFSNLSHR